MSYFGSKLYGSLSLGPIYTVRLNYETSVESYKLCFMRAALILIFYIYLMPQQLESYILINKQDKYMSSSKMPNMAAFRNVLFACTFAFILNFLKSKYVQAQSLLASIAFSLILFQ